MTTKKVADASRITVENVNVPGHIVQLDAGKYAAMRAAILAALPNKAPGLTQSEIRMAVMAHLSDKIFPGGAKAAWWAKMVQLDLEAKGIVDREATKPLRWHVRAVKKGKR
jgi:hypothetical protein